MRPWDAEPAPEQGREAQAARPSGVTLRDVAARVLYGYALLTHLMVLAGSEWPPAGVEDALSFAMMLAGAAACIMMLRLPRQRWQARRQIAQVLGVYAFLRLVLLATALRAPERDADLLIALAIGGSIWVALIIAGLLVNTDCRVSR